MEPIMLSAEATDKSWIAIGFQWGETSINTQQGCVGNTGANTQMGRMIVATTITSFLTKLVFFFRDLESRELQKFCRMSSTAVDQQQYLFYNTSYFSYHS